METIEIYFDKIRNDWHLVAVNEADEETEDGVISEKMARLLIKKMGFREIAPNYFASLTQRDDIEQTIFCP